VVPGRASRETLSIDEGSPAWYLAPVMAVMWPLLMRERAQEALDKTMANVKRIAESESA
jgi:hypothetical protein